MKNNRGMNMTHILSNKLCFNNIKTPLGSLNPTFIEDLKSAFNLDVFVETGTYLGDSAIAASKVFEQVHTIELSDNLYQSAIEKFKDNPKIRCYPGDSADVMRKLVPALSGRVLFWLDGHYSGGITSSGKNNTPILSELEAIGLLPSKEAVILIDDLRLFQNPKSAFKTALSLEGYPTVSALKQAIQEIFSNHQFIVYGDIAIVLTGGLSCEISPVVEGMTISRLRNEELGPSNELIKAERAIISAQGAELCALTDLYYLMKSDLDYGLAGHYHLWYVLTLIGKKDFASARDELQKLIGLGLINTQRTEWYNSILTSRSEALNHIEEKASDNPSVHNFVTSSNRLPSNDGKFIDECIRIDPLMHGDSISFDLGCGSRNGIDTCPELQQRGVHQAEQPLRIHLGCGKQYFEGYTNIDYPVDQREIENAKADLYADITMLRYPECSVDEIRLHHVFEHFGRVVALAQLIRWHEWLKPGGKLHIETPDIEGSARIILSDLPWHVKSATIRHLAGDQAAGWAYHVDHWCPERFRRTLSKLGFENIETHSTQWPHEPYLANVTVTAFKQRTLDRSTLLGAAYEILSESAVNANEKSLVDLWRQQLFDYISGDNTLKIQFDSVQSDTLSKYASNLPLDEIHLFNQRTRDRWVAQKASAIPPGSRVLDIGAGTCPYRSLFHHCDYKAQDFKKFTGQKRDGGTEYGSIDYESDITAIPVPDESFDVVLCTEVLEHVPEPSSALKEMARILRPGGRALLTVPLGSGLHQLPYHYYGGLSPTWYFYWGEKFGLTVEEITPNGGFFRLLAQESIRAASLLPQSHLMSQADKNELRPLLSEKLPRILFALEDEIFIDQFTVGYHVVLHKSTAQANQVSSSNIDTDTTDRYRRLMELKNCMFQKIERTR
jgi:predicted SAM-dependent methyltransferase